MAKILLSGRALDMAPGKTISDAVSSEGLHPDAYLYLIGGRPVPMDTVPPQDTEVKAVRVASGG